MKVGDLVRAKHPFPLVGSLGVIIQFRKLSVDAEYSGHGEICVQWIESPGPIWTIAKSLEVISENR